MTRYPVNNIYPCIQGEGVQTGVPMVLLRLHGCDVGCPFCDTRETWQFDPVHETGTLDAALGANERYCYQTAPQIATYIRTQYPSFQWVLITGGEPAQYPLHDLVDALHGAGYRCALETSGTETGHLGTALDWVCVSPKIAMPGGKRIQPAALAVADELKMVIGRQRDLDRLDDLIANTTLKHGVQICLQPVSQHPKATALCLDTVQKRGWRLSIQMHKYLALP